MSPRSLLLGAATVLTLAIGAGQAFAFSEVEIVRFHDACRMGHHEACVSRDRALHGHEHEAEWRHTHPEWFR